MHISFANCAFKTIADEHIAIIHAPSLKVAAFAAVRTLDDVTLISEATARAIHRLKQEEESEQEEIISCTASSTQFVTVMMRPALAQLLHVYLSIWIPFVNKVCQRNFQGWTLTNRQIFTIVGTEDFKGFTGIVRVQMPIRNLLV